MADIAVGRAFGGSLTVAEPEKGWQTLGHMKRYSHPFPKEVTIPDPLLWISPAGSRQLDGPRWGTHKKAVAQPPLGIESFAVRTRVQCRSDQSESTESPQGRPKVSWPDQVLASP